MLVSTMKKTISMKIIQKEVMSKVPRLIKIIIKFNRKPFLQSDKGGYIKLRKRTQMMTSKYGKR